MHDEKEFDVFISYKSKDRAAAKEVSEWLRKNGVRVWLDDDELIPGRPWQETIEKIIATTRTVAVLVGEAGIASWAQLEMRAAIEEFVRRRLPVIPVLLPGAKNPAELPLFLKNFTWVDLREGLHEDGLERLRWGITGSKRPLDGAGEHWRETQQRVASNTGEKPERSFRLNRRLETPRVKAKLVPYDNGTPFFFLSAAALTRRQLVDAYIIASPANDCQGDRLSRAEVENLSCFAHRPASRALPRLPTRRELGFAFAPRDWLASDWVNPFGLCVESGGAPGWCIDGDHLLALSPRGLPVEAAETAALWLILS